MGRIELELYADRLARHAERLRDDVEGGRMRIEWGGLEERARLLNEAGLKPLDALHFACAVEAGADYFCTCDDRLLKRARVIHSGPPQVVSPLELIKEIGP